MSYSDERSIICTRCLGQDSEHSEWDGWRGDCPYYLRLPRGTCSYGDCASPNIAEPQCETFGPQGPAPDPRGEPCWDCGGTGVLPRIRNTHTGRRRWLS